MRKNQLKKYKKKPVILSIEEKRLLEKYNKFRIKSDTDVPVEECVFIVDGVGCMPLGDLSAIKAEPKNGKTTALKRIVATVLKGNLGQLSSDLKNPLIMWVDTEQKTSDAKLIIEDVKKMTGLSYRFLDNHLMVYSLRKIDCTSMLEQLKVAIKGFQPHIVVIDGIAEFVNSVNDEVEAKKLIHDLMVSSETYHCAIICVLHENRSGNRDMKGHLGAQLTQKVAVVVGCKKSGDAITVRCTDSRHQSTPEWSIRFDEQGNIVDVDDYSPLKLNTRPSNQSNKKQQADAQKKQERIDFCLNAIQEKGGSIAKKDLSELLQKEIGMSRPTASNLLTALIKKDKILHESNKIITAVSPTLPTDALPF